MAKKRADAIALRQRNAEEKKQKIIEWQRHGEELNLEHRQRADERRRAAKEEQDKRKAAEAVQRKHEAVAFEERIKEVKAQLIAEEEQKKRDAVEAKLQRERAEAEAAEKEAAQKAKEEEMARKEQARKRNEKKRANAERKSKKAEELREASKKKEEEKRIREEEAKKAKEAKILEFRMKQQQQQQQQELKQRKKSKQQKEKEVKKASKASMTVHTTTTTTTTTTTRTTTVTKHKEDHKRKKNGFGAVLVTIVIIFVATVVLAVVGCGMLAPEKAVDAAAAGIMAGYPRLGLAALEALTVLGGSRALAHINAAGHARDITSAIKTNIADGVICHSGSAVLASLARAHYAPTVADEDALLLEVLRTHIEDPGVCRSVFAAVSYAREGTVKDEHEAELILRAIDLNINDAGVRREGAALLGKLRNVSPDFASKVAATLCNIVRITGDKDVAFAQLKTFATTNRGITFTQKDAELLAETVRGKSVPVVVAAKVLSVVAYTAKGSAINQDVFARVRTAQAVVTALNAHGEASRDVALHGLNALAALAADSSSRDKDFAANAVKCVDKVAKAHENDMTVVTASKEARSALSQ